MYQHPQHAEGSHDQRDSLPPNKLASEKILKFNRATSVLKLTQCTSFHGFSAYPNLG